MFPVTPSNNPSSYMSYHPPSSYQPQTETPAADEEEEEVLAISYPRDYQPRVVISQPGRRKVVSVRKPATPTRGPQAFAGVPPHLYSEVPTNITALPASSPKSTVITERLGESIECSDDGLGAHSAERNKTHLPANYMD